MNKAKYDAMAAQLDGQIQAAALDAGMVQSAQPTYTTAVVLTCGADLTPEPVQWLWPDWLVRLGKAKPPLPWVWPRP